MALDKDDSGNVGEEEKEGEDSISSSGLWLFRDVDDDDKKSVSGDEVAEVVEEEVKSDAEAVVATAEADTEVEDCKCCRGSVPPFFWLLGLLLLLLRPRTTRFNILRCHPLFFVACC